MCCSKRHWIGIGVLWLLIIIHPFVSYANTASNISIGSWIYRDIESLEAKGLLKSSLLSSKPLSRLEGARLIKEALETYEQFGINNKQIKRILERLTREFREELKDKKAAASIRPVESAYLKYYYGSGDISYPNANNNGYTFKEGSNLRAGFAIEARLLNTLSLYLEPEFRANEDISQAEALYGYAILNLANLEVEIGRDSMWWGSAYHGNLIMTNNAKPFDMVKLTSQKPFLLPWIFSYLGYIKPTWFLTELEEDRDYPKANLMGMRLDFKLTQRLQFGLSRVIMFGGRGRQSLTASDWVGILIASDSAEHSGSSTDGNQIISIDASYVYHNKIDIIPFSGIKLYTEWGAEDSEGETHTPTGWANVCGAFIDAPFWLSSIDLRIEWANTARNERYGPAWYRGTYSTGYRYEGNIIGHHMGTDAQDLFIRAQYHHDEGLIFGIETDMEWSDVHGAPTEKRWLGIDASYPLNENVAIEGGWGIRDFHDSYNSQHKDGSLVWINILLTF